MEIKRYRGYQRCSRIDYAEGGNAFVITICVKPRRRVFTNANVNETLVAEIRRLQEECAWGVYLYCIMPDHVHLVVNPGRLGLSDAVKRFKGRTATWGRENGDGQHLWQEGSFDHKIRGDESFRDKCQYVMQNPVRGGLVVRAEDYPWTGSFVQR
jgi:REP element-mobilizing transposase RayT